MINSQQTSDLIRKDRFASRRDGTILLLVLVVIVLLSLSAYSFTTLMQTEREAAQLMTRQIQSKYLVDSGVDYTRLLLSYDDLTIREKGGLWDNEEFQNVPVTLDQENDNSIGRFTIVAPNVDDAGNPEGHRFGLTNESSKLNLNVLPILDNYPPGGVARQLLMALPEMTDEIADAILDWLDEDDDVRDFGAESDFYAGLPTPYRCKNGPMDSLDELLLVRGVTPELLFGKDINRNGIIDQVESQSDTLLEADMQLGWLNYVTLYSKEDNRNSEGLVRVNINNPDLERLYDDLGSSFNEHWRLFVVMGRVNGLMSEDDLEDDAEPTSEPPLIDIDFESLEPSSTYNQVLDLVGTFTTMPDGNGGSIVLASPLQPSPTFGLDLLTAMENMTTFEGAAIPGRINIMQASRRILDAIPGLTEEVVDEIIVKREDDFELLAPEGADLNRKFETWLFTEGLVDLTTMRQVTPFICTSGAVYKAEVVGYFDDLVGTSRSEVYLDTTQPLPRILFWRDKSHLQAGYDIDVLGRDLIEDETR